jgi:hypothetical protein
LPHGRCNSFNGIKVGRGKKRQMTRSIDTMCRIETQMTVRRR